MAAYTTIDDPSAYFKVQLYTGNGSANNAITFDDTDTTMTPDLVWIKNRDAADSHCVFDSVRTATKVMHADTTAAEATDADTLDSFASDGFQVDADVKVNTNTEKYVSWNWKTGTTASGTTGGSGTGKSYSSSYNTTSGLQITAYTGNGTSGHTVPINLSSKPAMIIIKNRGATAAWNVWHQGRDGGDYDDFTEMQADDATNNDQGVNAIHNTNPSSSVVTLTTYSQGNTDDGTYLMYAFEQKQGYSKFGTYTGNGSHDGPAVFCGFAPAYVLRKSTDTSGYSWLIQDWERFDRINSDATNRNLATDSSGAEPSSGGFADNRIDFLSNGFKIRRSDGTGNKNNDLYIYMAFAEAPFVNSNGVPCNAR